VEDTQVLAPAQAHPLRIAMGPLRGDGLETFDLDFRRRSMPAREHVCASRARAESWQRRYWARALVDERDLAVHVV
jgi:hypothetical protein